MEHKFGVSLRGIRGNRVGKESYCSLAVANRLSSGDHLRISSTVFASPGVKNLCLGVASKSYRSYQSLKRA